MNNFKLVSSYKPSGDQPKAIRELTISLQEGRAEHVLLGVTGSGKTFTIANIIQNVQHPVLVISHNKTLAAQLYQELKDFFPYNAVSYFVSYYDYYQPEAYIPQTDTYIKKETQINEQIDKLRLLATTNILTRKDTIVVASVSCIYNIGSPKEYGNFILNIYKGLDSTHEEIMKRLVSLQYERSDFDFIRGTFRVRGEAIDIYPAYLDSFVRIVIENKNIEEITIRDPITGNIQEQKNKCVIYPAKHYMTDPSRIKDAFIQIQKDLAKQIEIFRKNNKLLEAQRISERVKYDLEMIQEVGYVNGIENYSRYFENREPGDPPYTLFDYYKEAYFNSWLLIIDESHMTIPQLRGMYTGDRTRKQALVDYGFRLPAALDNRPLRFEEFLRRKPQTVYVSATPDEWEIERAKDSCSNVHHNEHVPCTIIEQLIRPTGLLDPKISIRKTENHIQNLIQEIENRVRNKERVLVITLTKRMAEDLSDYLKNKGIRVHYLHADIKTLKRSDILTNLRTGTYDVIVGINLLREGLDLPEVSLVAILDADKEGFLRGKISLIQAMGRAARHVNGEVILYADTITKSIKEAVNEVERRRQVQYAYNISHRIKPKSITKPIRKDIVKEEDSKNSINYSILNMYKIDIHNLTPGEKKRFRIKLERAMRDAAHDLDFELALEIRNFLQKSHI